MPLSKIEIDSILGLTTNNNETSGINSPNWSSMSAWANENSSSGSTPPNTLLDCGNIIISRNKQVAARPPFEEVWDFTSTYGSLNAFTTTGIFSIPNSSLNSTIFGWMDGTTANIANFTNAVDVQMESSVNIIGSNSTSNNFTSKEYLLPDFSYNLTAFPVKPFNLARYTTSFSNIYIFTSNGVFRTAFTSTNDYIPNPTAGNFNPFKRVTLPLVRNLSAQITASPADSSRWFKPGYLVNIQIVVTEQLSGVQVYQGKPSRILTVINTGTQSSIQITFSVDNTNIFLNSGGVAIYRTVSYAPHETAPVYFYKCYESSLAPSPKGPGVTVNNVTTFTNIELTLNDSSITAFEQIYTSLNVESDANQSAESSAPPSARDVIYYNNYTVYGNVLTPPFAPLTMTALPNSDGMDMVKIGATAIALTYTPNSTTPPSNTGVIDATSGTFSGVAAASQGGGLNSGYNIVIRPQDPSANSSAGAYSVPYYAIASTVALTGGSGSTQDVVVTPKSGATFDITKFPTTGGFVAIIQSASTGYVVAIYSYLTYTQNTSSGTYTFSGCLAYGVPFSDPTWTAGLPTSANYVLYYIPGSSIGALPVYAIGSNATGYSSQVGFSLLGSEENPVYELFPTRKFNTNIVGYISSVTQPAVNTTGNFLYPVIASINFTGIYALSAGELLTQCVRTFCDNYNAARQPEDPYAVYNDSTSSPAGQLRFESIYSGYNSFSTYTTNSLYTNGFGYYDAIKAQVYRSDSTSPTVKFAEPIAIYTTGAGTPSNIMQQNVQTIAGLVTSKKYKPEEIPIGQNLQPFIVGNPLKPIIKMINQLNQLVIFKQNEGIYRIDIQDSGAANTLPKYENFSLLNNTAWLLLPESVQVFEDTIVYFSNKAFVVISQSGNVTEISNRIATTLLNDYSTIFNNGDVDKVRSWVITQQRLYCCYFPFVNSDNTSVIYVFSFDTGQWTKWAGEINDAVVSSNGVQTLIENIYKFSSLVQNYEQIQDGSINPSNKYWSVIRQTNFQNPSTSQIEDRIPFTDFTVSFEVGDDGSYNITLTNFNTNNVYGNIYNLLSLYKNRTIWYLSATQGFISATLDNAISDTSVTLKLVNNIYNMEIYSPAGFVPTTSDAIVTTVNSSLFFNKFFIANPRGSTLCQFNEIQLYMQEGEDYSDIAVGFNSTAQTSEYIYTSDGSIIVTTTGSFVVLNSSVYDIFSPYYVLNPSQYVFRILVPLNSARGRFIQVSILHDTPDEVFLLNSITYIYRDLNTTRIKLHS